MFLTGRLTRVDTYATSWKGKEIYFFKQGHIVIMVSPRDLPKGQTLSAGDTTICTIPEEFNPRYLAYGYVGNRIDDTRVYAHHDGIVLHASKDIVGAANLALTCVYYVE